MAISPRRTYCLLPLACCLLLIASCSVSKNYSPSKKYAPQTLQADYDLLREILERKHPSLYWYTPKEKMDTYFDEYRKVIRDSMTEAQFNWLCLAPLLHKIHCGHTSVSMSKSYTKWAKGKSFPSFPAFLRVWKDTMVVTGFLTRGKDSVLSRGTFVHSINGVPNNLLIKYLFDHLPEDGYADNVNYSRISGNFPYYHRSIMGLSKEYVIEYSDSAGVKRKRNFPLFVPKIDSARRDTVKPVTGPKPAKPTRKDKLEWLRKLTIDSAGDYAVMTVNTFSSGNLRRFFNRSFRELKKRNIKYLVLDLRSNGGGKVERSNILTRYLSAKAFRVADTVFANEQHVAPYGKYLKGGFLNSVAMIFASSKQADGKYHMRHFERHYFKPKKNRFEGKLYVMTNGPTFSAASLVTNVLKGQPHVTVVGEETGGGWYGNSGMLIPDLTLPETKLRVRLPLYRLVQFDHRPEVKGSGIKPDVVITPSYDALMKGYDKKMRVVTEMIAQDMQRTNH